MFFLITLKGKVQFLGHKASLSQDTQVLHVSGARLAYVSGHCTWPLKTVFPHSTAPPRQIIYNARLSK